MWNPPLPTAAPGLAASSTASHLPGAVSYTHLDVYKRQGEHSRYCRLGQPENSAVAEHALANADHRILFGETKLLSAMSAYFPCLLYTSRCV